MRTDPARMRSSDGFTLIEVLIAMVILSVGLLGLEALGIGAARMLVRAEKESRVASLATYHLEQGLRTARLNPNLGFTCPVDIPGKDKVCVDIAAVTGVVNSRRVTVTVIPKQGAAPIDTFVVSSTVYDPALIP